MTIESEVCLCLICGRSESTSTFGGLLRRCGACGFSWTSDQPAEQETLYGSEYFQGAGCTDYYHEGQRRFESRLRLKWLLSTGPVASLLEAGSACGFFIAEARSAGIDATGVEISAVASAYARDRLGVPVRTGAFETATVEPGVDVVCAFHVLEHVEDPAAFLRAAGAALATGGRLAIEVPNIQGAAAGRLGSSWPAIDPRYHRWHFGPGSLRRLLHGHGFTVTAMDTVFSRFYWQRPARTRHVRELLLADWVACGSPRISHPQMGDVVRVVARRDVSPRADPIGSEG